MTDSFSHGTFKSIHAFRGGIRRELDIEDDWVFDYETPYWIRVIQDNVCLDVYMYFKEGKSIIFSGQDALIDGRRDLPYFYRVKWVPSLPCSFVTFNDPSLYISTKFGAAYFSLQNSWELIKRVVDKIFLTQILQQKDAIFYGASAGGYWALSMAGHYPNSTFVVDIPQVNLETYFRENKDEFLATFELGGALPSVFDFWDRSSVFPKSVIYLQNFRDTFHIRTQQSFFMRQLGEFALNNSRGVNNINFLYYDTPPDTRAHSPMPQEKTIELLRKLVDGSQGLFFCL